MKGKKDKWKVHLEGVYYPDHEGQRKKAYAIILSEYTVTKPQLGERNHVRARRHLRQSVK